MPASENACPFSFLSLVHRTTSHGGDGESVSPVSNNSWLLREIFLLCPGTKTGDEGREDRLLGDAILDWNLLSKGRKDGVGLLRPGLGATEGRTLLVGDDMPEPCHEFSALPTCSHGGFILG